MFVVAMGNETSVLNDCHIDETPILKSGPDFSLHHAQRNDDKSQMTVFISSDQVGDKKNLLEMMGKVMDHLIKLKVSIKNSEIFELSVVNGKWDLKK